MSCSVLLPVYNGAAFLAQTIDSICTQDVKDFEFLIIDDKSPDGSADIIRGFARRDPRIRAVFHEKNAGLAATLNEGLQLASGNYVLRIDQDDVALPDRLRTQTRFLRSHGSVAVAGSFVYHMGRSTAHDRLVTLPTEHEAIAACLVSANCIYHPSVILDRRRILDIGGYRGDFHNSEDYDLWLRCSRRYRLANIPLPLLRYRFSVSGMTLGKKWQQMLYTQMALISFQHPELPLDQVKLRATETLAGMDQRYFLNEVAKGTMQELTNLGLWPDAIRVYRAFAGQLGWRRSVSLAREFAPKLLPRKSST